MLFVISLEIVELEIYSSFYLSVIVASVVVFPTVWSWSPTSCDAGCRRRHIN